MLGRVRPARRTSPTFSAEDERLLQAFAASAATAVATGAERRAERSPAAQPRGRRGASAAAGRASCTTRRCRSSAACGSCSRRARRSADPERSARRVGQALEQLDRRDRATCARSSPTCARPRWTSSAPAPRSRGSSSASRAERGCAIELTVDLAFEAGRAATPARPETGGGVYRIVQEALTNAVKHADAQRGVEVREADGSVAIVVGDDGQGFDPEGAATGFGLVGMRERTMLAQGTLEVRSGSDTGTAVEVTLPVGETVAAQAANG